MMSMCVYVYGILRVSSTPLPNYEPPGTLLGQKFVTAKKGCFNRGGILLSSLITVNFPFGRGMYFNRFQIPQKKQEGYIVWEGVIYLERVHYWGALYFDQTGPPRQRLSERPRSRPQTRSSPGRCCEKAVWHGRGSDPRPSFPPTTTPH